VLRGIHGRRSNGKLFRAVHFIFVRIIKTISTRYKNGEKVPNNHVKHFEYPIVKIETIDPQDEGLYQCFARNEYGEVSNNFYLHVRPNTPMLDDPPQKAKCFPMDKNFIYVTFSPERPSNKIQYYVAFDNPREFHNEPSFDVAIKSVKINTNVARVYKPFKPFYLYLRNMLPTGKILQVSQLSKPIVCATQGIEPVFVKPPNGIFFRWDTPQTDSPITGYTIQFLNNRTSNRMSFGKEVVGSYENFPTYVAWNDVVETLTKIPAKSSNQTDWTEVQVPGNVTGIYIINTEEVTVRILGTVQEDGKLFPQDLQYLGWHNLKASTYTKVPLRLGEVDSRGVEISWSGLDTVECAHACALLKQPMFRDSKDRLKCEEM
jgi:hypothetical protein